MISWIMGCKRAVPSYLMGWTVNGPNNYRPILNQLGPSIKYLYPRLRRSISCILKQNSMPSLLLSRQTDKRKEASGFLPPMHASTQTHLFFLSFCSALQILWDLKFLCVDEKGKQNEGAGGRAGGRAWGEDGAEMLNFEVGAKNPPLNQESHGWDGATLSHRFQRSNPTSAKIRGQFDASVGSSRFEINVAIASP